MSDPKTSEKSVYLDREEHFHRGNIFAKTVVPYFYDAGTDTLTPGGGNFINFTYDYVAVTYPDTVTEVFTFKSGGSGGTTQGTVTIVYTDDTKAAMSSVERT